jgi:hypothetical protein
MGKVQSEKVKIRLREWAADNHSMRARLTVNVTGDWIMIKRIQEAVTRALEGNGNE